MEGFECIFKERPADCAFGIANRACAATGFQIAQCYLSHYGNRLRYRAEIDLMDEFVHLLRENDNDEKWDEDWDHIGEE